MTLCIALIGNTNISPNVINAGETSSPNRGAIDISRAMDKAHLRPGGHLPPAPGFTARTVPAFSDRGPGAIEYLPVDGCTPSDEPRD
jgi:hypothetical protein